MKRLFDLTFKPFFVLTGMGTALGALLVFWPQWSAEKVLLIPFNQDYTVILQHWGIMLGLTGVLMIVAAFPMDWRTPILISSACPNIREPYARGF
jgi:membrane protein DedA with SNARE-associated domain